MFAPSLFMTRQQLWWLRIFATPQNLLIPSPRSQQPTVLTPPPNEQTTPLSETFWASACFFAEVQGELESLGERLAADKLSIFQGQVQKPGPLVQNQRKKHLRLILRAPLGEPPRSPTRSTKMTLKKGKMKGSTLSQQCQHCLWGLAAAQGNHEEASPAHPHSQTFRCPSRQA